MTSVFISYSRRDKLFAEKFTEKLNQSDLETWIDWEDIPATADWLDQIHKGIEGSDGFLFLLSPDSIQSNICRQEVEHAVQNAKRLIPIVVREVDASQVHPALAKVNWIYCREGDDFERAVAKTVEAIRTDLAFSPDGKWILTAGSDGLLKLWSWRSLNLIADLCSRLPRNLTRAEWNLYLGDQPYRATCPDLPIEAPSTPTPAP